MLIFILAVLVLMAWVHAGVLGAIAALTGAVIVYCLVTLVSIHHRCPSCRGKRVTGNGKRIRGCHMCKSTGKTRRLFATSIHRLAWTIAGPRLKAYLGERNERIREESGYGE